MGCCSSSNQEPRYHVTSDNRQLSSVLGSTAYVVPTGSLVDMNLPDTYKYPPPPIPYEAKVSLGEEEFDVELKKPNTPFVTPDECPTCLEEYDEENPKIMTKCEHHFHLSCILEWMERSDTCPVCDQVMDVSFPIDN